MQGSRPRGRTAIATLVATLALAITGAAAAQAAPTLLAPGQGKVIAKGSRPTFKVKDRSSLARRYGIFMTIAKSKKRDASGQLKYKIGANYGLFAGLKPAGHGGFKYKPPAYTFPGWFLVSPGKYYWQAYHIDCSIPRRFKCHVYSRIRSFVVR